MLSWGRGRALPLLRILGVAQRHRPSLPRYVRSFTQPVVSRPRTHVEKILLDSIKATGPISFATYMQTCLTLPEHGYYTNSEHPVLGAKGDFITGPEISQILGELIGIWFLTQWKNAGTPQKFRLIELGPGKGTLMDDILRVITTFALDPNSRFKKPPPLEEIHLVEASQPMRKIQDAKLRPFAEKFGCNLHWHDDLFTVLPSDAFTMVVAHEFFDALPFNLLQKVAQDQWREILIASELDPIKDARPTFDNDAMSEDVDPQPTNSNDQLSKLSLFRRVLSPGPNSTSIAASGLSTRYANLPVGSFLEVSLKSYSNARYLAKLIGAESNARQKQSNGGGCGLIVDYGDAKAFGDSFRAFQNHKIVDVFHQPGESDLTTNVDFALISEAMNGWVARHGPITQANFLNDMGMSIRVQKLVKDARNEERRQAIVNAAKRLADPVGMGVEYKVFGFTSLLNDVPFVYPFEKPEVYLS